MDVRSPLTRVLRQVHHVVFDASRAGRSGEIATWSNGAASLALSGAGYLQTSSVPVAMATAVIAFVALRAALAHRLTVWIAAVFGTLAIAGIGGGIAWLFGHVIDAPSAPSIAAVFAAVLSATAPAWAYAKLAQRRRANVPDSLVAPNSVSPRSRR